MVYGIIGMINFAHGDVFMLGGFAALITLPGSCIALRRPAGGDPAPGDAHRRDADDELVELE